MMVVEFSLPVAELVLFLGISLVLGYGSSLVLQRIGIPNVLVYIIVGFFVGNLLVPEILHTESFEYWYEVIETIALGLIGFQIGTEMDFREIRKDLSLVTIVTVSQIIFTFGLVFVVAWLFTGDILMGMLFGGLASATAPAAIMEIIRKFKAKGPLTTRLQWIVALDDMIVVLLVEGIIAFATISLLGTGVSLAGFSLAILQELGLAIIIGAVIGFLVDIVLEMMKDRTEMMEITLAALILTFGVALYVETSVILAAMTVGALTVNREGKNYKEASEVLEVIMSPILIIFFVLVGSELTFSSFNPFPWFALIYFVIRFIGKVLGANIGANISNASPVLKRNLGISMVTQGGVTLGLMTVASNLLTEAGRVASAEFLVTTIVITTVFFEGIGSFTAMFGLGRAGELSADKAEDNPVVQKAMNDSTTQNSA